VAWTIGAGAITSAATLVTGLIRLDKIQAAQEADKLSQAAQEKVAAAQVGRPVPGEGITGEKPRPGFFVKDLYEPSPVEDAGQTVPAGETSLPVEKIPAHWTPENITVGKGGSYWSTFMKQYQANPEYFGYEPKSGLSVEQYGNKFAVENFKTLGIMDTQGNEVVSEFRIKSPDAQIKWSMADGALHKEELQPGGLEMETYKHEYHTPAPSGDEVSGLGVSVEAESVVDPSTWDKEGGWTRVMYGEFGAEQRPLQFKEIAAEDFPKDFKPNDDLSLYALDQDADDKVNTYDILDEKKTTAIPITRDNAESSTDFKARAIEKYHRLTAEANELARTVGAVKDLSSGDRLRIINGLDLDFKDGVLSAESKTLVTEVVNKLGDEASKYLQDQNLGAFIKAHITEIEPAKVGKLYEQGVGLRGAGVKYIDYEVVNKWLYNRMWHFKGGLLESSMKSPFTKEQLAASFKGGVLNQEVFDQTTQQVIDQRNNLTRALDRLVGTYESSGLGTSRLNPGTMSKIMDMPANGSLVDWQEKFGGTFKDATVAKLYEQIDSQLGGKLGSGRLSGTVGENLEKIINARHELYQVSELEKFLQAQDELSKANAVLKR